MNRVAGGAIALSAQLFLHRHRQYQYYSSSLFWACMKGNEQLVLLPQGFRLAREESDAALKLFILTLQRR
jgi:hypothetical protein